MLWHAATLQVEHHRRDPLRRRDGAASLLADIPVLTELASQIAEREEDRGAAAPAAQAVLLAEVLEIAADDGVPSRLADAEGVGEAVDVAVARADLAGAQLLERFGRAAAELRGTELQVRGRERLLAGSMRERGEPFLLFRGESSHTRRTTTVTRRPFLVPSDL